MAPLSLSITKSTRSLPANQKDPGLCSTGSEERGSKGADCGEIGSSESERSLSTEVLYCIAFSSVGFLFSKVVSRPEN